MQELASLPLLAQSSQPMLAHQVSAQIVSIVKSGRRVETSAAVSRYVAVETGIALRAESLHVGLAYWLGGKDSVAVGFEEEGREGERVGGVAVVVGGAQNLGGEGGWGGARGGNYCCHCCVVVVGWR